MHWPMFVCLAVCLFVNRITQKFEGVYFCKYGKQEDTQDFIGLWAKEELNHEKLRLRLAHLLLDDKRHTLYWVPSSFKRFIMKDVLGAFLLFYDMVSDVVSTNWIDD